MSNKVHSHTDTENKEGGVHVRTRSASFVSFFSSRVDVLVRVFDEMIVSPKGKYIPGAIFLATFGVSVYLWNHQKDAVIESIKLQLENKLDSIIYAIQGRVHSYEQILYGIDGYFHASNGYISPESFERYITQSRITKNYPEIASVSISYNYSYTPMFGGVIGDMKSYAPIMHLEPNDSQMLGFDNLVDPDRADTIRRSQKISSPALSGLVTLAPKGLVNTQGCIMFHSIYLPNNLQDTDEQRQKNIFGWSAVAFNVSDLVRQSLNLHQRIDMRIYDTLSKDNNKLLFESSSRGNISWLAVSVHKTVDIGDREWTFVLSSTEDMHQRMLREVYLDSIIHSGIIVSLILTISSLIIIRTRRESLETQSHIEYKNKTISEMESSDSLTGLPNRTQFIRWIENSIAGIRENKKLIAVMYLDLDEFKRINNTLGYAFGDEILCQVAARLSESIHGHKLIAREGSDEFLIGIANLESQQHAMDIASQIIDNLRKHFEIRDKRIHVSSSIGLAISPTHALDAGSLLSCANMAMHAAKTSGKNKVREFSDDMQNQMDEEQVIQNELSGAIENNEFSLNYQPIVDVNTGEIVAMEALLRWNNPILGNISPAKFIPIAEADSNLIKEIGLWTLRSLCEQMYQWKIQGITIPKMHYNLSINQLRSCDIYGDFRTILDKYKIAPEEIEIEITESTLLDAVQTAITQIQQLSQLGFRIALDDFGIGFANLDYLKESKLSLDTIKIDKSFVDDILHNENERKLVHAMIQLAKRLGKKVVAEGVETSEQFGLLKEMGCDCIQGYLHGRPESAEITTQRINKDTKGSVSP